MGENLKEKEYYRQSICDAITKIDKLDMLVYLNRLIQNILKAGR